MTCCFLGHRKIYDTEELRAQSRQVIEELITNEMVDTFLFGSKSGFNSLCYEMVTDMKEEYPHIKRIYVRAEFPVVDKEHLEYLTEYYEDTFHPESVIGVGRAAYIKRNMEMIDRSRFCVFYYDEICMPKGRNSGTKIAFHYALKRKKEI